MGVDEKGELVSDRTVAITGANRGIGLGMARLFAQRGDRVVGLCRRSSDALNGVADEVVEGFDVAAAHAVRSAAARLQAATIDVLVNDAGILSHQGFDDLGSHEGQDEILRQFQVNAMGPLRVTHALADRLGSGAKVALITSRMGSIGDNDSGSNYGYRMSKAALNAAGKSLALDLAARGVAVGILHPGFVRTEMTQRRGHVEPAEAAAMLVERIDALEPETAGRFFHANGEELPW
jgi:NAD(P)-dependent dehydrogenase (short-subunit alcohol dehydrogenase family)